VLLVGNQKEIRSLVEDIPQKEQKLGGTPDDPFGGLMVRHTVGQAGKLVCGDRKIGNKGRGCLAGLLSAARQQHAQQQKENAGSSHSVSLLCCFTPGSSS
jgi:hypothetical protein